MALIDPSTGAVFVGADDLGDVIHHAHRGARCRVRTGGACGDPIFLDSEGCHMLDEARAAGIRLAVREQMRRLVRRVLAVALLLPVFDSVWPSPDQ
jgi:hypothetical protein